MTQYIHQESVVESLGTALWLGLERVQKHHLTASKGLKSIPFETMLKSPSTDSVWQEVSRGSRYVATLSHDVWTDATLSSQPLYISLGLSLFLGIMCFLLSIPTRNVSHVDRLWYDDLYSICYDRSLTPPIFVFIFAFEDWKALWAYGVQNTPAQWSLSTLQKTVEIRMIVMSLLTILWGARLTANFARKGGYKSLCEEDYRWAYVKKWPILRSWIGWTVFNFTFISMYQNLLLWAITLPAYYAYQVRLQSEWTSVDTTATVLFLLSWSIEWLADRQQWQFYRRRHIYQSRVKKVAKVGNSLPQSKHSSNVADADVINGFNTKGLFRFSRHPNFFAEQCIWWSFYLFSYGALFDGWKDIKIRILGALPSYIEWNVAFLLKTAKKMLSPHVINESGVGALLLTLLFLGSVSLTESISMSKYPAYKQYRKTTSRMILWFPGPSIKAYDKQ